MKKLFLLSIVIISLSNRAFAFAENATHGYPNCMSCHVAPSGGGLLNDYGRSLSKELMSTWGWKNSEQPLFGAMKNTANTKFGGDFRAIQTYYESDQVKQGKQFVMQKNVEIGVQYSKLWFVATLGTQEGPKEIPTKGKFLSERHYLLWNVSDDSKIKVGKFRLNFGLNDPNHTRVTKQPLGFGPNSESYIMEFSHFTEDGELFISSDLGRIDLPKSKNVEKSISSSYSRYISEKAKIGASILLGESELKRRSLTGTNGVIGFFDKNIIKYEVDLERSSFSSTTNKSQYQLAGNISWGV